MQSQIVHLEEKDQMIIQKDETIAAGLQEIQRMSSREQLKEQMQYLGR